MLNILLFGPPGAGKGTQSARLIEKYQLVHISTGDLFRKHLGEGTPLGNKAKEYMNSGKLVPDALVIDMVDDRLKEESEPKGFIFDGFPRTVAQAEALDELLSNHYEPIKGMVALEVPEDELRSRLKQRAVQEGRVDDQDDSKISSRINEYQTKTLAVAGHYKAQDKYASINGVGSIDEIFNQICDTVDNF